MNMIRPRRYARIVRSCESYPLKHCAEALLVVANYSLRVAKFLPARTEIIDARMDLLTA